jgi:predicted XRE-type DNA-binding protein
MKRKLYAASSGNVFLDLGFAAGEAQNLLVRSDLMLQLRDLIRRRKLTQARAARLFGVTQPRISDLMRGKIELFSVDGLIGMLGHAGLRVSIRIKSAA